jgi:uncharacterized lipoprotein YddW (UPF0748 family)
MYRAVKLEKPWAKVGISPFGIWRPGYPAGVWGLDAYRDLYADARKWLNHGWLDYMAPQLYWPVAAPQQSYVELLRWWVEENRHGRHIWAGNIPNRVGTGRNDWPPQEVVQQIRLTREQPGASGNILFSMSSLLRDRAGVARAIAAGAYAEHALVPPMPWLEARAPAAPAAVLQVSAADQVNWLTLHPAAAPPAQWLIWQRTAGRWTTFTARGTSMRVRAPWIDGAAPDIIAVAAVSRTGIIGEAVVYQRD